MTLLLPERSIRRYLDLDIRQLKKDGIRILFVDIDNTISAYGDTKISNEAAAFLHLVRHSGIEPVLLTNNTKKHVEDVLGGRPAGELLTFCLKPLPHKVHRFLKKRNVRASQAAIVGDQLYTDMLCGRISGMHTILCGRLSETERKDTSIMRALENAAYTYYEKKHKIDRRDGYVRIL